MTIPTARLQALRDTVETAFQRRSRILQEDDPTLKQAVREALDALNDGRLRIAEKNDDGEWIVNPWLKKAVLLSFRINPMTTIEGAPDNAFWWDKIHNKHKGWTQEDFQNAQYRAVPGCHVRHGAHIAADAVLMPCFVNIGAYVGRKTMIDTWATVGSCAQIGDNVHISGGVGIGGVLEPLQAAPVIVEDDCFIGARSEIAEGVRIGRGAVVSMGVFLGASTKIVDRSTGTISYGAVPPYAVVVPGTLPPPENAPPNAPSLACAVIVKTVDEKTRAKTAVNDLLRA